MAAVAVAQVAGARGVRLRVLGSPAEETGRGGKLNMIEAGLFRDVDAAMMAHAGYMNLPSRVMLCRRDISVEFCRAVTTSDTRPLGAMLELLRAMDRMRSDVRPRTRLDGVINQGGRIDQGRIHCDNVCGQLVIRGTSMGYVLDVEQRLNEAARGAAGSAGVELRWTSQWGPYLPMKRNGALEKAYADSIEFMGEKVGVFPPEWDIGSTDFGNVSQVVPGIHAYFKAAEPGIEHHTREYAEASRSELGIAGMVVAAKAMALTALELTFNDALLRQVRTEFQKPHQE
jgi:metal-dependent amidase/aminoacylase/carboxypeptidase family protein